MIELLNISKKYKKGNDVFTALKDISLKIGRGDFCSVIGLSGAGKSTLLYIIGGLIHPDSGSVSFEGKNTYNLTPAEGNQYRKKHLGFMFQQFHLMPWLTIEENIRLACWDNKHKEKIEYYFDRCSLKELKNKYPSELSVGEKQRTAFIRAIISQPDLLLADEPTGNLDTVNSEILMSLVKDYNMNGGTVVMVSHDPEIARFANKSITLNKGRLE
jgi:putative ABC transport system ATP-binding protein